MRQHPSPNLGQPPRHSARPVDDGQAGMTLAEVLVAMALMAIISGAFSILVGAAVRSKMITSVRSADTQTARQTLEWMSERLRNAGLNVHPTHTSQATFPDRCKDRVVALPPSAGDTEMRPTAGRVFVSGEILNSDATSGGDEVITLGYFLGADALTGRQVVREYRKLCQAGSESNAPLSDPRIQVTSLQFRYFGPNGAEVTDLVSTSHIRRIQMIRITLQVQGQEGTSGVQVQTWTRDVMLRNPEPNANLWINPGEVNELPP